MRLIDVDNYCENICRCNSKKCDKQKCPIHTAPTAYDVDKIFEQLEKLSFLFEMKTQPDNESIHEFASKCIEIVKKGGVE